LPGNRSSNVREGRRKMKKAWISSLLMIFLLFVAASHGLPADFRCGVNIISIGTRKAEVLRKCGEPASAETWEAVRYKGSFGSRPVLPDEDLSRPFLVKELVTIEEWEYNLGPGQFIRYLRFENGRLIRITTGDYGY
jgi:hypothetical protein